MSNDYQQNSIRIIPYTPQLDGVRFCAVLFVLCFHWLTSVFDPKANFFFIGFINFFFVLSSYLITKILIYSKEKGLSVGVSKFKIILFFLFRRSIRIFPAYYVYLILLLLIPVIGDDVKTNVGMYFSYLANYQIFHSQNWPTFTSHLWTLAVEEQFYILWPLIILFIPHRYLFKTLVSLTVLCMVARAVFYAPVVGIPQSILTQYYLDPFAIGALLAYKYTASDKHSQLIIKYSSILLYFSIAVAVGSIFIQSHYFSFIFNNLIFSIISMKLIEGAIFGYKGRFGRFLENRMVLYLGKISYGIYLYHLLVPVLFWKVFNMAYIHLYNNHTAFFIEHTCGLKIFIGLISHEATSFFIYAALTVAVAALSWILIERPFNGLKRLVKTPKAKS